MPYRLIQERGELLLEQQSNDGYWVRTEERWPPYLRQLAENRLRELEAEELPQLFED